MSRTSRDVDDFHTLCHIALNYKMYPLIIFQKKITHRTDRIQIFSLLVFRETDEKLEAYKIDQFSISSHLFLFVQVVRYTFIF